MAIRQRAIQAEDKHERHHAILDAAERLLLRDRDRVANVAEVADEAGLAKGTVYLYFPGKEELLLALHERNIDKFFGALIERLEADAPVTIADVQAITHAHIVEPPLFLPLAARCFGLMAQAAPSAPLAAFKQRMGERLARAGAGLERHFRGLAPGEGVVLLRHSYALILGLWQMWTGAGAAVAAAATAAAAPHCPGIDARTDGSYAADLDRALNALWQGTVGPAPGRA